MTGGAGLAGSKTYDSFKDFKKSKQVQAETAPVDITETETVTDAPKPTGRPEFTAAEIRTLAKRQIRESKNPQVKKLLTDSMEDLDALEDAYGVTIIDKADYLGVTQSGLTPAEASAATFEQAERAKQDQTAAEKGVKQSPAGAEGLSKQLSDQERALMQSGLSEAEQRDAGFLPMTSGLTPAEASAQIFEQADIDSQNKRIEEYYTRTGPAGREGLAKDLAAAESAVRPSGITEAEFTEWRKSPDGARALREELQRQEAKSDVATSGLSEAEQAMGKLIGTGPEGIGPQMRGRDVPMEGDITSAEISAGEYKEQDRQTGRELDDIEDEVKSIIGDRPKPTKSDEVIPEQDKAEMAMAKNGGLSYEAARDFGLTDTTKARGQNVKGFGKLVVRKEGGLPADEMATRLAVDGYVKMDENGNGDVRDFEDKLAAALKGDDWYSDRYAGSAEDAIFDQSWFSKHFEKKDAAMVAGVLKDIRSGKQIPGRQKNRIAARDIILKEVGGRVAGKADAEIEATARRQREPASMSFEDLQEEMSELYADYDRIEASSGLESANRQFPLKRFNELSEVADTLYRQKNAKPQIGEERRGAVRESYDFTTDEVSRARTAAKEAMVANKRFQPLEWDEGQAKRFEAELTQANLRKLKDWKEGGREKLEKVWQNTYNELKEKLQDADQPGQTPAERSAERTGEALRRVEELAQSDVLREIASETGLTEAEVRHIILDDAEIPPDAGGIGDAIDRFDDGDGGAPLLQQKPKAPKPTPTGPKPQALFENRPDAIVPDSKPSEDFEFKTQAKGKDQALPDEKPSFKKSVAKKADKPTIDPLAMLTAPPSAEAKAIAAEKQNAVTAVDQRIDALKTELENWKSRKYKDNKKEITTGDYTSQGEGAEGPTKRSIGYINRKKREKAIKRIEQDLSDLKDLKRFIGKSDTLDDIRGYSRDILEQTLGIEPGGKATEAEAAKTTPDVEPWKLTPKEYEADATDADAVAISRAAHANHVKDAIAEGKDVPLKVLESYKHNQWAKNEIEKRTPKPSEPGTAIEDFGEKIGGARKDYHTVLDKAKEKDTATVPFSQSFPEPDYNKLIEAGIDPFIVGFVRAARDEVPAKPRARHKIRRYVEQVELLRTMAENLLSGELSKADIEKLWNAKDGKYNILKDTVGSRAALYEEFGHGKSLKGITLKKNHFAIFHGEENVTKWLVERGRKATAFSNMPQQLGVGDTKEEALESFRKIYDSLGDKPETSKKTRFDIYEYRDKPGVWWIGKAVGKSHIDLKKFESVKEAKKYLGEEHDALVVMLDKAKYIPDVRRGENEDRVGVDRRGGENVTPESFSSAFGFRGVEFGNWVSKRGERQKALNLAYDALHDLAEILGAPTEALSLNGELGLAFGARGTGGKKPAAAHYEPDRIVINLTRKSGAGSLAHEWWHGLDNYFSRSRKYGDEYLSERAYQLSPGHQIRPEMVTAFKAVVDAYKATGIKERSGKLDRKRSKPYWDTGRELSARVFENYIIKKLADKGYSNDYLANIVSEGGFTQDMVENILDDDFSAEGFYPYLTKGEESGVIKAFDKFFDTIETKKTDKGTALYSKTDTVTGSTTKKRLDRQFKNTKMSVPIKVVQSESELSQRIIDGAEGDAIEAVVDGGQLWVVADNVTPERAQVVVVRHEGSHVGMPAVLGDKYDDVMDQVRELYDLGPEEKPEEKLADLAEDPSNKAKAIFRRVVRAIKEWIRKRFPNFKLTKKFTKADAVGLVEQAIARSKKVDAPVRPGDVAPQYAKAFHGTPHVWKAEKGFPHGRIRLDKIGTGEGAAVYGWGFYTAEAEGTGQSYLDPQGRGEVEVDGKKIPEWMTNRIKAGKGKELRNELRDRISKLQKQVDNQEGQYWLAESSIGGLKENLATLEKVEDGANINKGSLYTLDIPDSVIPKLLDWDKPLSEQSEVVEKLKKSRSRIVRETLEAMGDLNENSFFHDVDLGPKDGASLYRLLSLNFDGRSVSKKASEALAKAGIPGNKYLDQMSRGGFTPKQISATRMAELKQRGNQIQKDILPKTKDAAEYKKLSAELDKITTEISEGESTGTSNFVIWDQDVLDKVSLLKRNEENLDAMREDPQYSTKQREDLTPVSSSSISAARAEAMDGYPPKTEEFNSDSDTEQYFKDIEKRGKQFEKWVETAPPVAVFGGTGNVVQMVSENTYPDSGKYPWRVSYLSKQKGKWIPSGHSNYKTKLEAFEEADAGSSGYNPDIKFSTRKREEPKLDIETLKQRRGYKEKVDKIGDEGVSEYIGEVQTGDIPRARKAAEKLYKDALEPVENNALDKAASEYLSTGDFDKMVEAMPAMGEVKAREVLKYDEEAKKYIAQQPVEKAGKVDLKPQIRESGFYAAKEFADEFVGRLNAEAEKLYGGKANKTLEKKIDKYEAQLKTETDGNVKADLRDKIERSSMMLAKRTKAGAFESLGPLLQTKVLNNVDIDKRLAASSDPTRMIQAIDGGIFGMAAQKHVMWPTRRNTLAKLRWADDVKAQISKIMDSKGILTGKESKAMFDVVEAIGTKDINASNNSLLKREDIDDLIGGNPNRNNMLDAAKSFRQILDTMLDQQNAARKARKQKEIKKVDKYMTWVREQSAIGKFMNMAKEEISRPEMPDFIFPNKPHNPREIARETNGEYLKDKDVIKLIADYADVAARDIFDTNIIHNNKIFAQTLRNMGLENGAAAIDQWTSEAYGGVKPRLSRWASESIPRPVHKGALAMRRNLTRAVFPLNLSWNLFVQTSSAGLTAARYGAPASVAGLKYFTDPALRKEIRDTMYTSIMKNRYGGSQYYQDVSDSISKHKRLQTTKIEKAEHFANYLSIVIEDALTGHAIAAAYHHGKNKLGLKGRELQEYASEGGAKTQSMYDFANIPGILRNKEVGAVVPFQTFAFEVFNTVREMNLPVVNKAIGQTGTYRTTTAGKDKAKDEFSEKMKMIARWAAAGMVSNAVASVAIDRDVWGWTSFMPFSTLFQSLGNLAAGKSPRSGMRSPIAPLQAGNDLAKGISDMIKYGNPRRLRKLLTRYFLPGGIQIERIISGMEAWIRGREVNVAGRKVFDVEKDELLMALFAGPYKTRGGREYIKKLEDSQKLFKDPKPEKPKKLKFKSSRSRNRSRSRGAPNFTLAK